jgi:REP element-mobilizing transposase RayT
MVLANHAIFTAYAFWLPNDGRGSWSTEVWAKHLRRFGDATKTNERRSLAKRPHDRNLRLAAKAALKYPPVVFDGHQARAIAQGFGKITEILHLKIAACAIMPDHVHMVVLRHRETIEQIVGFLKRAATRELTTQDLRPLTEYADYAGRIPTPWADGGWHRFLNSDREIVGAIDYVDGNPTKVGYRAQHWPFVIPFVPLRGTPRGRGG